MQESYIADSLRNVEKSRELLEMQELKYQKLESQTFLLEKINHNLQLEISRLLQENSSKSQILNALKNSSQELLILSKEFNQHKKKSMEILEEFAQNQKIFTQKTSQREISALEKVNELNKQLVELQTQHSSQLDHVKLQYENTEKDLKAKVKELENDKNLVSSQLLKEKEGNKEKITKLELQLQESGLDLKNASLKLKELQNKELKLQEKELKLSNLQKVNVDLDGKLKEKESIIKDLENEISDLKIIIESLEEKVKEKAVNVEKSLEKLKKYGEKVHVLQLELEELQDLHKSCNIEKHSLKETIQDLQEKLKKSVHYGDLKGKNQQEWQKELKDLHKFYEKKVKDLQVLLEDTHKVNQKKVKEYQDAQVKKLEDTRKVYEEKLDENCKKYEKELDNTRKVYEEKLANTKKENGQKLEDNCKMYKEKLQDTLKAYQEKFEDAKKANEQKLEFFKKETDQKLDNNRKVFGDKLEETKREYEENVKDLQRQLSELTISKENVLKEMDVLIAELEALKEKLDIYKRAETMGLHAQEQLEKSSNSYLQHNDHLKQSNQTLETEIARQRSDLQSAREEIESLIVREDELKKCIRKLKVENHNLASKLEKSDAEWEKFKTEHEALGQDILSLKTEISSKEVLLKNKQYDMYNLEQRCQQTESELQSVLPRYSSLKEKLNYLLTYNAEVENELVRVKTELNVLKPEKCNEESLNSPETKTEKKNQDDPFKETGVTIQDQTIKRKKSNTIFQKLSSFKKSFGSAATLNDSSSDTELFNELKRLSSFVDVNDKTPKDVIDAVLTKMEDWNSKISSLNLELHERDDFVKEQSKKLQLLERLAI